MLLPPSISLGCVRLLRCVEEGAAAGRRGCCNGCERFESSSQHGLRCTLCTHVLVSPLLRPWAEENILHLKSQNFAKSTVGKKGGTGDF